jgi:hypothetical protein
MKKVLMRKIEKNMRMDSGHAPPDVSSTSAPIPRSASEANVMKVGRMSALHRLFFISFFLRPAGAALLQSVTQQPPDSPFTDAPMLP